MLHQTLPILGQLWQLFEVSQILEFLWYMIINKIQVELEKGVCASVWTGAMASKYFKVYVNDDPELS